MSTQSKVYYLAGPMSGIPQFNYPKFNRIAGELRNAGFEIHSPPEHDSPLMQERCLASPDGDLSQLEKDTGETWGDVLAMDVKFIADKAAGVIVMDGWERSRGAQLEVITANICKKPVYEYIGDGRIQEMALGTLAGDIVGGIYARAA
jgi:hypothetical protein